MKTPIRNRVAGKRWSPLALLAVAAAVAGCSPGQHAASGGTQAGNASAATNEPAAAQAAANEGTSTGPTVLRQALAPALYELVYSGNQDAVFVASAGGTGDNARLTRILRLDPRTLALQTEIPMQNQGFGLALDDAAQRLYVGNALDASITVVDTLTNKVTDVVTLAGKVKMTGFEGEPIERPPHNLRELVLDKANHRLFAPGLWINDSALYVMDTQGLKLEKVIPGLGFGAAGVALDEQGGKVYVSNLQGQLFRFDARTLALEETLEVEADQLLNLVFDPKNQRVLAVDQGAGHVDKVRETVAKIAYRPRGAGNRVVVINPETGAVEQSIHTDVGPVALKLDTERNLLYVTNRGGGTVTVFDANDGYRQLEAIALPTHPNSLAIDPDTGAVFVTIKNPHQAEGFSGESVARIAMPPRR